MVSALHSQVREAGRAAGKQIKHRMFVRDILTAAVAVGDEADNSPEKTIGYQLWSSGTLGSSQQKSKADSNGYSSRMAGGSIGADTHFENDLLLGASFSKIRSSIKEQSGGDLSDLQNQDQNTKTKYDTYILSLYGLSQVGGNMSISVIGSAGLSKGKKAGSDTRDVESGNKPRSKLFSLELHLNYKIALLKEVNLIPHIGLKYEYENANRHKEKITNDCAIERPKKSYQALNTEIGNRVIFAPIKLTGSTASIMSITPTAHFSVERRIGSRGKSHPCTLTYSELGQTIGAGSISANTQNDRTSLNTGIGLIASRKNIKLELLLNLQRQKRFKSHQGVLKLKLSL
ncbi:hypothetical protein A3305_07570 (plasmid) [Rickettsia amblyommatis]|uniref:Cell surface antigen Sca12 n=3 Tax=Rickettsia amblyommatis TaxID=33989 RepID=H8K6A8_RICAG|nr:autotransporter outer membrane beta-barrel domain-containing protein [Rickettsia amblyommatis]ADD14604.1 cell surface antigen Sca12 [Rickettsia amblyommatis str. AaR/SC]AFC70419.1 cell surface antigen Sca12 [Rickettsia amblyommatis str. GAT-30V]ARD88215.1 hypothetical protein A3305_07570 [Rickettsia amblyommatis]KJV99915.1 outer membrane autotransporter barrel domain protein [Rickettsia amblyommatis str. Darkwater]